MPVHFYIVAMLFIVFDVELVFLFPWAVMFRKLGLFGLIRDGCFYGFCGPGILLCIEKTGLRVGVRSDVIFKFSGRFFYL